MLYFIVYYNMDFRVNNSFLQEFVFFFCLNGIWIVVPFLCMKYVFQDLYQYNMNSKLRMDESKSVRERKFDFRESTLKQRRR